MEIYICLTSKKFFELPRSCFTVNRVVDNKIRMAEKSHELFAETAGTIYDKILDEQPCKQDNLLPMTERVNHHCKLSH